MRRSNAALRLLPSLLDEARTVGKDGGVGLNHLINAAVAEKLSALLTEQTLGTCAARAASLTAQDSR